MKHILTSAVSLLCLFSAPMAYAADRPVIVELFTSHGCSSCPAADKIVREFSQSDSTLLPLSFHVTYWDNAGFKDPYALEESTMRQRNYAQLSGRRSVFTPQVVVEGNYSAVGNNHEDVNKAIRLAKTSMHTIPVTITENKYDMLINIAKMEDGPTSMPSGAAVWLVYYTKHSMTPVNAGENSGRTIENINNVVELKRLGFWHNDAMTYHIPKNQLKGDGLAIILQSSPQNQVLGAAMYEMPKT